MRHVRARVQRRVSLYVRSALALGLLLGLGAAATDAAWTDQEIAGSTFTTATFNTESSLDGGASYADRNATAGALAFTPVSPTPSSATASSLYPGATLASSFVVRAKQGSIAGKVTAITPSSIGTDAVLTALQYRMYWDTAACSASSFAPSANGAWLQQTAVSLSTAPTVPAAGIAVPVPTPGAAGTPVYFCVQLTMPTTANPPQGTAAGSTFTWTFATQNS